MYFLILIFLLINFYTLDGRYQYITVTGRFLCKGEPLKYIDVALKDDDLLDWELITTGRTDYTGVFNISGKHEEFFPLRPYVEVLVACCKYVDEDFCEFNFFKKFMPFYKVTFFGSETFYSFGDIEVAQSQ
uniref:Transthyretin-like family-containing protein n=1 Tax=Strongyloides venezuelensis TaxID=75913 RepID=A0A0K0FAM5_STRVS